jgi:hypothetical protein
MFASSIMAILVLWLVASQLVGFRMGQLVDSKSGASDSSRKALQQLATDIRSCKMWNIGSLSGTNFTGITSGAVQGSALQLCQTTNGSQFTIYYFVNNGANNNVLMKTSVANWNPATVCSNLLDDLYFTAEMYNGQIQTNSVNNVNSYKNIIHVTLDFCQFQYPLTQVGTNGLYDFYKLDIRATPHLPE